MTLVHEALLYADRDEYVAGTVGFLRGGFDTGEPALVAVPGINGQVIRSALGDTARKVRFLDMVEAGGNPGRIIPAVLHAFVTEHGDRPVRIVGEPIWAGRTSAEYPACAQHEALINVALGDSAAWILCPYDINALKHDVIEVAHRTHPIMVRGDQRERSEDYADPVGVAASFNVPFGEPPNDAFSLVFGPTELAAVRHLVTDQAVRTGLFPDRIDDFQIAVNEVATNAITHSGGPGSLRVWRETDRVVCEITSPGQLLDPLAGRVPPPLESEHGRGLLLVHHLCDLVQIYTDPGVTAVRIHVKR